MPQEEEEREARRLKAQEEENEQPKVAAQVTASSTVSATEEKVSGETGRSGRGKRTAKVKSSPVAAALKGPAPKSRRSRAAKCMVETATAMSMEESDGDGEEEDAGYGDICIPESRGVRGVGSSGGGSSKLQSRAKSKSKSKAKVMAKPKAIIAKPKAAAGRKTDGQALEGGGKKSAGSHEEMKEGERGGEASADTTNEVALREEEAIKGEMEDSPRETARQDRRSKGGGGVGGRSVLAKKGVARKSRGETVRSAGKGRGTGGAGSQMKEDDLPSRGSRKMISRTERMRYEEGRTSEQKTDGEGSKRERPARDPPSVESDMSDAVDDGLRTGSDTVDKEGFSDAGQGLGLGEKEKKKQAKDVAVEWGKQEASSIPKPTNKGKNLMNSDAGAVKAEPAEMALGKTPTKARITGDDGGIGKGSSSISDGDGGGVEGEEKTQSARSEAAVLNLSRGARRHSSGKRKVIDDDDDENFGLDCDKDKVEGGKDEFVIQWSDKGEATRKGKDKATGASSGVGGLEKVGKFRLQES